MRERFLLLLPSLAAMGAAAVLVWALYWFVVPRSWRRPLLILASAAALMSAFGIVHVAVYAAVVTLTYALAKPGDRSRRAPLIAGLVVADLALFGYAYYSARMGLPGGAYFSGRQTGLLGGWAPRLLLGSWNPRAPLILAHLMFAYTLARLVTYIEEICTGQSQPRGFLPFLVYVAFLPALFMGPIARFGKFYELSRPDEPRISREQVRRGLRKVFRAGLLSIGGMGILFLIALVMREGGFPSPQFTPWKAWAAILLNPPLWFAMFGAYSDLAIGLGRLFGYELPENFEGLSFWRPNMAEFWRTWHISMALWIRDYLYVPLGGNRRHQVLNFTTGFVICGLWHQPTLHFILWGAMNGFALGLHVAYRNWKKKKGIPKTQPRPLKSLLFYLLTFIYVALNYPMFNRPALEAFRYYAWLVGIRL